VPANEEFHVSIRHKGLAAIAVAALAACGGGGGGGGSTTPVDTTDIASWRQRDAKPLMSVVAGPGIGPAWPYDSRLWQSSTRRVGVLPMWGAVQLANGREGIVLAPWGNAAEAESAVPPMRLVMFEQGSDGLMREATAGLVGNDITDGSGHVTVADFNGDGRDDFALPMYTETPVTVPPGVPTPRSVAYVSRPDGRYERLGLSADANGPHMDALRVNGQWQLFVPGGGYSLETLNWSGFFTWRWNGAGFTQLSLGGVGDPSWQAMASAALVRDFANDGNLWMVRSDSATGPGLAPGAAMTTRAWPIDAGGFTATSLSLPAPYFNGKAEYQSFESWLDPQSKTHNARIWSTDLNQDGRLAIVAGAQIWGRSQLLQKATLQLLVNQGGMNFVDQTEALKPEFRIDGEIDYSPRFVDIDGSGIDTILMGQGRWLGLGSDVLARSRHGSYILVNDGTGRLYAAMDAEFTVLGQQVLDFVNAQDGLFAEVRTQPSFMAYRRPDGKLNFLAQLMVGRRGTIDPGSQMFAFVNVPLGIDIATGIKRDLNVPTRNGSRNIRTFAGNDTIGRALADPDCRIDGGLGTNTVVYPGRRADWVITKTGSSVTVAPAAAGGGADTLTRVQQARFDDQTVDLTAL
jgi:hypothetical protein